MTTTRNLWVVGPEAGRKGTFPGKLVDERVPLPKFVNRVGRNAHEARRLL